MADKRLLKTAIIISVALLLLCIAAAAGTTYAWFTDQATSQRNTIQVGTLDVELEFSRTGEDGDWHDLLRSSNTFSNNESWLPGNSQHVYLRIRNKGSLSLKYKLSLNILEETGSINVKGENYVLSQYLKVGSAMGVKAPAEVITDRPFDNHINLLTAANPGTNPAIVEGYLDPNGTEIVTLVVRMPANLDKEINYPEYVNGPELTFGIDVVATQRAAESDSLGSDYDEEAIYPEIGSPDLLEKYKQEGWI